MSFRKKNVKILVQKEVNNRRMRIKQPKMCKPNSNNTHQSSTKSSHHSIIRNKPQVMSFKKKNIKMFVQNEIKNRKMTTKQPKICKANNNSLHQCWTKSSHNSIIRNKAQVMTLKKNNMKIIVQNEIKNRKMKIKQPKICKANNNKSRHQYWTKSSHDTPEDSKTVKVATREPKENLPCKWNQKLNNYVTSLSPQAGTAF